MAKKAKTKRGTSVDRTNALLEALLSQMKDLSAQMAAMQQGAAGPPARLPVTAERRQRALEVLALTHSADFEKALEVVLRQDATRVTQN